MTDEVDIFTQKHRTWFYFYDKRYEVLNYIVNPLTRDATIELEYGQITVNEADICFEQLKRGDYKLYRKGHDGD